MVNIKVVRLQIFKNNWSYLLWCHENIKFLCFSDEIFEKVIKEKIDSDIDFIHLLVPKQERNEQNKIEFKRTKRLREIHTQKKYDYEIFIQSRHNKSYIDDNSSMIDWNCDHNNFAQDPSENPWIDVFGPGDEAETAYWNTN